MADRSITTKRCTSCGRTLPTSAFVKHRQSADGLYSRCKECHRGDQSRFPRKPVKGGHRRKAQANLPGQKRCAACKQDLPLEAFGRRTASSDGLHYWCKACNAMRVRAQRETLTTERIVRPPQVPASGMRYCSACKRTLPVTDFGKRTASSDGLHYWCRSCNSAKVRDQRETLQDRPRKPPVNGKKYCPVCQKDLPIADFGKRSASPDGLHYWCRPCLAVKTKSQRSALKAEDPEAWRSKHRESARRWRSNNPETWRPKHKEQQERRRQRMHENGGDLSYWEWEEILRRYGHCCVACGEPDELTIDHIVPIAKGGRHSAENVQPLCRSCNSSKGSSIVDYRPERQRRHN